MMLNNQITIGTSVMRRDGRAATKVINELQSGGWEQSGSLGNRVTYLENSGFSLTVVDGPAGTLVVPSGPIRGRVFGNSGLSIGRDMSSSSSTKPSDTDTSQTQSVEPKQPQRKESNRDFDHV